MSAGQSTAGTQPPVLRIEGLVKRYPGVLALDNFSLELAAGEVRALLGKNGAGKSTALKILSGAVRADSGAVRIDGLPISLGDPQAALDQGIATVYQEISLVPALTVSENIFLGRWSSNQRVPWLVSQAKGRTRAQALLDRLKIDLSPDTPVHRLNVAQQQLVEIAKAVSHDPRVLVLDEPTSALPAEQVELLHEVVRTLAGLGTAMLYVTHRLHEVPRICDRVTVLRDGRLVDTIEVADATPARITELMVGSDWRGMGFERRSVEHDPVMKVRGLSTATKLLDVSFELHRGEVLGLAGLLSSGRTELLRALFGVDPMIAGEITVNGAIVPTPTPARMKSHGVALTTEDRKRDGLVLDFPVSTNATLAPTSRISHRGWLSFRDIASLARHTVDSLGVTCASIEVKVGTLSGGNQQKIVVGNWLNTRPGILLMDEPSRGIDVAAKQQIFQLVRRLAGEGMAVLFVSSEIEEVLDVCDRVLVIHEGRITAAHNAADIKLDELLAETMGVTNHTKVAEIR